MMPAIIFMVLFGVVVAVLADMVVLGSMNTREFTNLRREQTLTFFKNLQNIINDDITLNQGVAVDPQVLATANYTPKQFIEQNVKLATQGNGNSSSAAADAWGVPVDGVMKQGNVVIYTADGGTSLVTAPITYFAFVSQGSESKMPKELAEKITQAQNATGVSATQLVTNMGANETGNTIVYTFSDLMAQRKFFENIKDKVDQIANIIGGVHQRDVTDAMRVGTDPTTVPMPDVSTEEIRKNMGIQSIINDLTTPNDSGKKLRVSITGGGTTTLTITVDKDPTNPFPWPAFQYVKVLKSGG
jgi:hypothetical protein